MYQGQRLSVYNFFFKVQVDVEVSTPVSAYILHYLLLNFTQESQLAFVIIL